MRNVTEPNSRFRMMPNRSCQRRVVQLASESNDLRNKSNIQQSLNYKNHTRRTYARPKWINPFDYLSLNCKKTEKGWKSGKVTYY